MSFSCDPDEAALKTFFLGPQAENGPWLADLTSQILFHWFEWRKGVYPQDGRAISDLDQKSKEFLKRRQVFETQVLKLLKLFEKEIPKFSPRYVGHMFSEISLPALLGHMITLLHNPNNISSEASRIGVQIENEAIISLASMVGYDPRKARGHFTSGGTLANIEALERSKVRINKWLKVSFKKGQKTRDSLFEAAHMGWKKFEDQKKFFPSDENAVSNVFDFARNLSREFKVEYKGPVLLVPASRHYSWDKGVNLLSLGSEALWPLALDRFGHISVNDLTSKIEKAYKENRPILLVTSVAGSTEFGSIDNIDQVQETIDRWRRRGVYLWHHVDAAYGGFFRTLSKTPSPLNFKTLSALDAIPRAHSLTLDPHKLGYVPYASGAFLCSSPTDYALNYMDAPYINYRVDSDRGPVTIEGSRSAAGAAATWMTSRCIGFNSKGYGKILERTIKAAAKLESVLKKADRRIRILPGRDTNIICFCIAYDGEALSKTNSRTLEIYKTLSPEANHRFIVSKTVFKSEAYGQFLKLFFKSWKAREDVEGLTLIRLCMMNPFHDSKELKVDLSLEFVQLVLDCMDKDPGS